MGYEPISLDELVRRTGWSAAELNVRLLELELGGVVAEIDKLFGQRFDELVNSLELGRPPRGSGGSGGAGGHGGGRRPRHLH